MHHLRGTTGVEFVVGTLALFLLGVISAAADLYASLRRIVPASSRNAEPAPIDRCEIR